MTDFDLRGVLASNLLCWHRLTSDEVDNLIAFFKAQQAYQAGRDSMKSECVKAVDDAGGDNTDYHMNAMKELK